MDSSNESSFLTNFKNRYHHETWSINHKSYLKHFWQFNRCLTLKHRFWPTLSLTSTPNFRSQSHEFLNLEFQRTGFESRSHHFFSLQPGDQILSINKHDLRQVTKNQAENLINKEINKVSATGQGTVSPIFLWWLIISESYNMTHIEMRIGKS